MNWDRAKTYGRHALRLLGLGAVVGGVVVLGVLGWQWQATATVDRVTVTGTQHAPPDTVRHLARVDSGTVMETVDEALIADRVERHPWVRSARVATQRLQGTLRIGITERAPAALALDARGRPAYYLAPTGHAMPVPDSAGIDVPLVRGLQADYHPVQPVAPPMLRTVMGALRPTGTAPLVAELAVQPDSTVRLMTRPLGAQGPMAVRLGTGRIRTKLRRLRAFAEQALAARPERTIDEIDLRFEGQIVTRTTATDES
jgi:cell division protein FtsQ